MWDSNSQKWRQVVVGLLFCQCVSCEISCSFPPLLEDGYVLWYQDPILTTFPLGFQVTYFCKPGYRVFSASRYSRCGRKGWSLKNPHCVVVECPDPGIPENGETLGTDYIVGSKVSFICRPGYELLGSSELECLPEGQWSDKRARCNTPKISCSLPPPLEHGTILELFETPLTTFPLGFEVTYVCDEGYRILSGLRRRRCGRKGWSRKTPRCEVVECPDPGVPENGETLKTDYRVGSKVSFVCYPGCELLGSSELECLPGGQWSDVPPRCNAPSNYCPDPGAPIGGSKNTTKYGRLSRVGFRCRTGHILEGSEVRECLENKTWSGVETRCVALQEFDNKLQSAVMLQAKKLKERERSRNISSSGSPGILDWSFPGRTVLFFAFDVSHSLTLHDFKRGIIIAKKIVKRVGISVDGPRAGALTFSSRVETQFSPVTYNSTEAVLTALDSIEFSGGSETDVNSVFREIREDSTPRVKSVLGEERIKSVLFLLTDGKVNRGGDPGREANLLKAQGVKIFCIGMTADVRKRTLDRVSSTSRSGEGTRPNVIVPLKYTPLDWVVHIIAEGRIATFDAAVHLRVQFSRYDLKILNVSCISEEDDQQIQFSRLLDTGTGRDLPTGARIYSRGRAAFLDLSGVRFDGQSGVYECALGNGKRRTFAIDGIGYFVVPTVKKVGFNALIDFFSDDLDNPSFRWMHDGEHVPPWDGQAKALIRGVGQEDAGFYERYKEGDRRGTQDFYKLVVRECPFSRFGERCNQRCPTCYNGGVCHEKLGTCICVPGFDGEHCEKACGRTALRPATAETASDRFFASPSLTAAPVLRGTRDSLAANMKAMYPLEMHRRSCICTTDDNAFL